MSTAADLNDSEMEITLTDTTTGVSPEQPHVSSLAVPSVKIDQINNWTGVNELPFDPVAERVLEIAAHDEQGELQQGALSVVIARPLLIEGKGWACLYKLDAMGRTHISPARGVDAVDALQQAFAAIHRQLQGMGRMHKITFGGGEDLGFGVSAVDQTARGQGCPVMNGTMGL